MKIKTSEEPIEIKSPKEDENTTDWYDKNKFKKILAILIVTNLIIKIK